jgi:hypothetical protein
MHEKCIPVPMRPGVGFTCIMDRDQLNRRYKGELVLRRVWERKFTVHTEYLIELNRCREDL